MKSLGNVNLTAVFEPAAEGGFTCSFEELPEVCSEGEILEEAEADLFDALKPLSRPVRRVLCGGIWLPGHFLSPAQGTGRAAFPKVDATAQPVPRIDARPQVTAFKNHPGHGKVAAMIAKDDLRHQHSAKALFELAGGSVHAGAYQYSHCGFAAHILAGFSDGPFEGGQFFMVVRSLADWGKCHGVPHGSIGSCGAVLPQCASWGHVVGESCASGCSASGGKVPKHAVENGCDHPAAAFT